MYPPYWPDHIICWCSKTNTDVSPVMTILPQPQSIKCDNKTPSWEGGEGIVDECLVYKKKIAELFVLKYFLKLNLKKKKFESNLKKIYF